MSKKPQTVNIRGKEYEIVASRTSRFREDHPLWTLTTEIMERTDKVVIMCATIKDETGRVIANGHAEEVRASSAINRTSAVENAETSAIGRALAALGYIGSVDYASAEEVESANKGIHRPSDGAEEHVNPERMNLLADVEIAAKEAIAEDRDYDAFEVIDTAGLDADEKVALWTRFDSKQRARLKKAKALAAQPVSEKEAA